MLPIAGAAGLGLLGLIGVGVALRSRKRRNDEELAAADQYEPQSEASAQADPLFAEPSFAPRLAVPASALPAAVSGSARVPVRLYRSRAGQPRRGRVRWTDRGQPFAVNQEAAEARALLRPA